MNNNMILSLNTDTFSTLKSDFDTILGRTIGNMEMKGADEAVITLKLSISLEKSSVSVDGDGFKDIIKPNFKHDISSVMQVKDKMTGQFKGDFAMEWDDKEKRYVLRRIDNGQMNFFDDEPVGKFVDANYTEIPALPAGEELTPQNDITQPFGWLCQFIGQKLVITEAMGNYTVRTEDNKVVLSSATSADSPFYCSAETLAAHKGHKDIVCVGYGGETIVNVSIECEECCECIFDLNAPDVSEEEIAAAIATPEASAEIIDLEEVKDEDEDYDEAIDDEDDEYEYDDPEDD